MKIKNSWASTLKMRLAFTLCLALLLSSHTSYAEESTKPVMDLPSYAVDQENSWRTHEVREGEFHFDLIYNAKHHKLATLYVQKIKQSYQFFKSFIQTFPDRTVIVLLDQTDLTNGYATPVPYPHMVLYPVLPDTLESLGETSDWPLELFTHEMTHILTFEPTRGVMKTIKSIFGTIVAPNLLLPTWWKEGVAVEMETQIASAGRLRSKHQDAYLRTLSLADRWSEKTIDRVNEELPEWPRGQHPYIFGSLFFSYAVKEKGLTAINNLFQMQAGRIPYFIEGPALQLLDSTYSSYFIDKMYKVQTRATQQIAKITSPESSERLLKEQNSLFQLSKLDFKEKNQNFFNPQVSADGKKIAFLSLNKKDETLLQVRKLNGDEIGVQLGQTAGAIGRFQFSQDGQSILLSKVDATSYKTQHSDLYLWDFEKKKIYPMSFSLRCREVQFSPQNDSYICVQVSDGQTRLLKGSLNVEEIRSQQTHFWNSRKKNFTQPKVLFSSELQEKISYPVFLNENEIIYSYRNLKGEEYLEKYSLITGKRELVLKDDSQLKYPLVVEGDLYFLSDENGTFNIYSYDFKSKQKHALTNTPSTYANFAFSPATKSLWTTLMTDDGLSISHIPETQWRARLQQRNPLPSLESLMGAHYSSSTKQNSESSTTLLEPSLSALNEQDYSPWPYLIPSYWLPFVSASQTGYLIEAQTSAFDPLNFHSYALSANYDSYLNRGGYQLIYSNQQALRWGIEASRTNRLFGARDFISTTDMYALSLTPDMTLLSKKAIVNIGAKYATEEIARNKENRMGPFLQMGYVNYNQTREAISPMVGYGGSLIGENYIEKQGYLNYTLTTLTGLYFHSAGLPEGHAIAVKVNGFHIFDRISHLNGTSSQGTFLSYDSISPTFVLRGYENGKFFGRSLISSNLEYRFPIINIYRGSGTDPYFFKRLYGAFTFDTLSVDGYGLNRERNAYRRVMTSKRFYSYGAEAHLESTIGYVLPLTFILGYYTGQDKLYNSSGEFNLSLLIGVSQ